MNQPTDHELVRQVLAGARARYSHLVERHQARLYRFALGMLSRPEEARACVEEAFVRGYSRLKECPDKSRFGVWIFGMVRVGCRDRPGAEGTGPDTSGAPAAPARRQETAGEDAPRAPTSTLQEAIRVLPDPDLREVFLLKHVEGLDFSEVAELLETDLDEVRRRVRRAREALLIGLG
jgi:RNA polymerase sigma-70 factor, ECF subfamily